MVSVAVIDNNARAGVMTISACGAYSRNGGILLTFLIGFFKISWFFFLSMRIAE